MTTSPCKYYFVNPILLKPLHLAKKCISSYITFRSCKQLDGKHTIFGKLVGGMDTLTAMEQIEVDNKDRPIHDIIIEVAQVFVDPYAEAEEQVND